MCKMFKMKPPCTWRRGPGTPRRPAGSWASFAARPPALQGTERAAQSSGRSDGPSRQSRPVASPRQHPLWRSAVPLCVQPSCRWGRPKLVGGIAAAAAGRKLHITTPFNTFQRPVLCHLRLIGLVGSLSLPIFISKLLMCLHSVKHLAILILFTMRQNAKSHMRVTRWRLTAWDLFVRFVF